MPPLSRSRVLVSTVRAVRCSWCSALISGAPAAPEETSHGVCLVCSQRVLAEDAARKRDALPASISFDPVPRNGQLVIADEHGQSAGSACSCPEHGAEFAAELVRRWNLHAGFVGFALTTLDGCFCDDGRNLPECPRCVEARALLARVRGT